MDRLKGAPLLVDYDLVMPEQLSRAVGEEISRLLTERGMSGNQLAKATGIPQPTIARKLRGASPVDLDDVQAICAVLEVDVADLLAWAQRS